MTPLERHVAASKKAARTRGRMKAARRNGMLRCSCCNEPRAAGRFDRYCRSCRAIYMRNWRSARKTGRETPLVVATLNI